MTVLERIRQFLMYIWGKSYTPAVRMKICRACYTRGARSTRSCGWWGKRGRWRGGG